jgi:hypothetical protein
LPFSGNLYENLNKLKNRSQNQTQTQELGEVTRDGLRLFILGLSKQGCFGEHSYRGC